MYIYVYICVFCLWMCLYACVHTCFSCIIAPETSIHAFSLKDYLTINYISKLQVRPATTGSSPIPALHFDTTSVLPVFYRNTNHTF